MLQNGSTDSPRMKLKIKQNIIKSLFSLFFLKNVVPFLLTFLGSGLSTVLFVSVILWTQFYREKMVFNTKF